MFSKWLGILAVLESEYATMPSRRSSIGAIRIKEIPDSGKTRLDVHRVFKRECLVVRFMQ